MKATILLSIARGFGEGLRFSNSFEFSISYPNFESTILDIPNIVDLFFSKFLKKVLSVLFLI